jgi:hypothetical protein
MRDNHKRGLYWAGLPVIATVARLLCRADPCEACRHM